VFKLDCITGRLIQLHFI